MKWLAATSTAGTSDRLAAAKATFSTESSREQAFHVKAEQISYGLA
ncbi:hypothetical protein ACIRTP_21985 [Pseudomonas aeruginosa]